MAKKLKFNRASFIIIPLRFYIFYFVYRIKLKICLIITYINLDISTEMDLISYIFILILFLKGFLKKGIYI